MIGRVGAGERRARPVAERDARLLDQRRRRGARSATRRRLILRFASSTRPAPRPAASSPQRRSPGRDGGCREGAANPDRCGRTRHQRSREHWAARDRPSRPRLRRLRRPRLRDLVRETRSTPATSSPLFVARRRPPPIEAMPGVDRLSIAARRRGGRRGRRARHPGRAAVRHPRREGRARARGAWDDEGVVQLAVRAIKDAHPELVVITDVCLCEYTEPRPLRPAARRTARRQRRQRSSCSRAPRSPTRAPAPTSSRPAT